MIGINFKLMNINSFKDAQENVTHKILTLRKLLFKKTTILGLSKDRLSIMPLINFMGSLIITLNYFIRWCTSFRCITISNHNLLIHRERYLFPRSQIIPKTKFLSKVRSFNRLKLSPIATRIKNSLWQKSPVRKNPKPLIWPAKINPQKKGTQAKKPKSRRSLGTSCRFW